jgi:hypothetical protein
MNDETTNLDQADEEILTCTVSDEALEAAAGEGGGVCAPSVDWCPATAWPFCP